MAERPHVDGLNGPQVNAICWLSSGFATATLIARLISRIHLTKHYGIDDTMIIVAYVFLLAMTIVSSVSVHAGSGSHFDTLSPHQKVEAAKWVLVVQAFSPWTLAMPKLSVVALLVRVFEPRRWISILFWVLAILGVFFAASASIVWCVQCHPIDKIWDHVIPGRCWPRETAYKLASVQFGQSVIYDFIFAAYPVTVLMKLQMSLGRKLGVCTNMALGVLAGLVGIVKLARLGTVSRQSPMDPTYVQSQVTAEVVVESALLIIAACVPTSGPVLVRLKSLVVSSISSSYAQTGAPDPHPFTISHPRPRRRPDDDLEYGDEIPMTLNASTTPKKDVVRVHSADEGNRTFFSSTDSRSFNKSARSSDESRPP